MGDLKEFWHVGRELPSTHPHFSPHYGPNLWPKEVPSFRANTLRLFDALAPVK